MGLYTKVAAGYVPVRNLSVNQGGTWKNVNAGYVKDGGLWQQFYPTNGPIYGGDVIDSGNYRYIVFYRSGILTVPYDLPVQNYNVFLLAGGGGGGGCNQDGCTSGGGGAGGCNVIADWRYDYPLMPDRTLYAGTYLITVGAGGPGDAPGTNTGLGGDTSIQPLNVPGMAPYYPNPYPITVNGGGNGGQGGGDWDGAAFHNPDGSRGGAGGGGGGQGTSDHNHRNGVGAVSLPMPIVGLQQGSNGQNANGTGGAGAGYWSNVWPGQGVPVQYWASTLVGFPMPPLPVPQKLAYGGYGYQQIQTGNTYGDNTGFGGCGVYYDKNTNPFQYYQDGCSGLFFLVFPKPV